MKQTQKLFFKLQAPAVKGPIFIHQCRKVVQNGWWKTWTPDAADSRVENGKTLDLGYVIEATFDVPEHLHELLNDYPIAVQKMKVSDDMLSSYKKKTQEKPES